MLASPVYGRRPDREDGVAIVMVCAGTIVRAKPSCAMSAILRACALVSFALVAIDAKRGVLARPWLRHRAAVPQDLARIDERVAIRPARASDDASGGGIDDVAGGVDRDQGGDGESARQRDRRGADAALHGLAAATELADRGAGTGADAAFGDGIGRRGFRGCVAARRVGPDQRLAADRQIEQHRGRHDRHIGAAERKADLPFFEIPHDAGRRIETEGAAAGEHDARGPARRGWTDRADRFRACRARNREPQTPPVAPFSTRMTVQPVGLLGQRVMADANAVDRR